MKIDQILKLTEGTVICGENRMNDEISQAFCSDLMSDVLTLDIENILLISGLANLQLVRTAEMADIHHILLARNKKATAEMIDLARENRIMLIETKFSLFRAGGVLYAAGLKPVY
jgi:hypothetical protein